MPSQRETVPCQYRYDPLDRLIGHALPDSPERQRFYCKSRLASEVQGANRYSIVQHGDQLLAQQQSEGDAPDTTLLATDQQRSVWQALKSDHPRTPIAYSPYGHRSIENRLLSLLGFNGERPDPVTGCYLLGNGYRAFNPVLMRFNSPDSKSPFGEGGINPYAYCQADPVNQSDPTGHVISSALAETAARHVLSSLKKLSFKSLTSKQLDALSSIKIRPDIKSTIAQMDNSVGDENFSEFIIKSKNKNIPLSMEKAGEASGFLLDQRRKNFIKHNDKFRNVMGELSERADISVTLPPGLQDSVEGIRQ